mmetsp:Transcript_62530/g.179365  ORF Transcript_62530/g.179365 Transcript_62530/m.179365 type:complete len:387 (-) Transcript_62530:125-1285(-)
MSSQSDLPLPVVLPREAQASTGRGDFVAVSLEDGLPLPALTPQKPSTSQGRGGRRPEVDWIKAVAIVMVVMIHSLPDTFTSSEISHMDVWIGQITRFAVPSFLACSGYITSSSRSSRSFKAVRHRLERLLLPYLVFSVVAWCYQYAMTKTDRGGEKDSVSSFILNLLLCSELGPYYYVFLILCLVLVTPLIARLPQRAMPFVFCVALGLQFAHEEWLLPSQSLFWQIRSPARSLAPFLAGWLASQHRESIVDFLEQGRRRLLCMALLSVLCLLSAVALFQLPELGRLSWALIVVESYAVLALLFVATVGPTEGPEVVSWLSNASYTIYLSHYYFLTPVLLLYPYVPGTFDPVRILLCTVAGLGNSASLVLLGRSLLGESRARKWIG